MALIACPECGGKVSDKAKACIHCVIQLNQTRAQIAINHIVWFSLKPLVIRALK